MLILSRKLNEELVLNESVRVRIVELGASRVCIGITAPDDVPICRVPPRSASDAGQLDCEPMLIAADLAVPV